MTSDIRGGIIVDFTASSGSKYTLKFGYDDRPVVFISFFDAARFTNWLNNGQGNATTESGAYTLSIGEYVNRTFEATVWIPSNDEWHKAAYYQPDALGGDADSWWSYPTQSNAVPASAPPNTSSGNSANYDHNSAQFSPFLTDVGSYAVADSYYGTFDQGGNVAEWTDNHSLGASSRNIRGGSYIDGAGGMLASNGFGVSPTYENRAVGFRVASSIPEPSASMYTALGILIFSAQRRRII